MNLDLPEPTKDIFAAGYTNLLQRGDLSFTAIDVNEIRDNDDVEFESALEVDEVLSATGTGVLTSGVYTDTTIVSFTKKLDAVPPVCLVFRTVGEQLNLLQDQDIEHYPGLVGGIFDGYICTKWSRPEIYTDRVEIITCATLPYTHSYLIYVLKYKVDATQR